MKDNQATPMMIYFFMVLILSAFSAPMVNADDIKLSDGQTVYVPIYSHIYSGFKARPFDLFLPGNRKHSKSACRFLMEL